MGRFTRAIRGFFGRFLSGVEQRNPEILLENAVQDELENLKRLQVAAARTMAYEKMLTSDAAERLAIVSLGIRHERGLLHSNFVVALLNDLFMVKQSERFARRLEAA